MLLKEGNGRAQGGRLRDSPSGGAWRAHLFIHPATVERLHDGWLQYSFMNRDVDMKNTSGAPIIDHRGKVVAVNANIIKKSGKTIGYGTPVVNFYPTLATLVQ